MFQQVWRSFPFVKKRKKESEDDRFRGRSWLIKLSVTALNLQTEADSEESLHSQLQ
ncbi:MAG: hypothetical protein KME42_27185 [Tildeniella nuda ZEHNDER 1965/U140]|jgi:hypothetical protein|nr:hypothetical protein [Tildeniella nuda ZEHNDER 1965/U140]